MVHYLKILGVIFILLGIIVAGSCSYVALTDKDFYQAAKALEKHPDHLLYRSEYFVAKARHDFVLYGGIVVFLAGFINGSLFLALSDLARRVRSLEKLPGFSNAGAGG